MFVSDSVFLRVVYVYICLSFPFQMKGGKRKPNSKTLENLKDLWNSPCPQSHNLWDFLEERILFLLWFASAQASLDSGKVKSLREFGFGWLGFQPCWWIEPQCETSTCLVRDLWCDHKRSLTDPAAGDLMSISSLASLETQPCPFSPRKKVAWRGLSLNLILQKFRNLVGHCKDFWLLLPMKWASVWLLCIH